MRSTNTFYAPLLATYLHPNVVHLVYDLFPEAMIHSGKWTEGTLRVKLIRWITKQTLKRAKVNVFLGERLKDYVESIHGPVPNSAIIAVGADQSLFGRSPKERLSESEGEGECPFRPELAEQHPPSSDAGIGSKGVSRAQSPCGDWRSREESDAAMPQTSQRPLSHSTFTPHSAPTVLYCGNFGNMHDSATLFEYWRTRSVPLQQMFCAAGGDARGADGDTGRTRAEAPRYVFHCSGPKRSSLEAVHRELSEGLRDSITLGGGLDQAEWISTMETADVALVTMSPGAETVVMPSKTYSAMMAGQAILAIAPEASDLVDLIKEADCGWWVIPGDVGGLATAIEAISADPEGLLAKRQRAFHYAHANFGQDTLAAEWGAALQR